MQSIDDRSNGNTVLDLDSYVDLKGFYTTLVSDGSFDFGIEMNLGCKMKTGDCEDDYG